MARTRDELMRIGQIDPIYQAEVDKFPAPEKGRGIIALRRNRANHLATLRKYYPIPGPIPEVQERDMQVQMRDGVKITIRIYSPQDNLVPAGGSPLYVAYHEGGWCSGDLTDEEMNCRMFSKELGAVCVNVDYSAGFVVGGASAGGNISAILVLLARDESLNPPLTGQYLCVPAVLPPISVPAKYKQEYISWGENIHDPILKIGKDEIPYSSIEYTLKMDILSPLFNPAANPHGLENLPPAYFQDARVETKLDLYPGYGHMFWTNYPGIQKSREFVNDTLEGVRWLMKDSGS
ncbi:alpha/beta-hydrolase [Tothia fuscella]|uniref:Alpha/beta-hydrolase n=1 Tax=Tothia fuscella TaxID=1048955 RepID=A0A9P4NWE7_9PEZI|nr:alpha/beta-hydrolase [Tothia fuscella]